MDADITRLESRIDRLIVQIERLNSTVELFKEQQRPDWIARTCAALLVLEVVFVVWVFSSVPPP
jgi:hypothetical protein